MNDRGDLIEESRYNGLGHRIGYHSDQDLDNDVEDVGDPDPDPWIYNVYDDSWRVVAVFKSGSAVDKPHERYVYHAAGMDGRGSSSYIDDVILRERDDDVLLTGTASESLMDRMYYLQNWRHDVVALVRDNGSIVERPRYSSYGVARTATVADFNHDGVVEDMDFTLFTDSYDGYVVGYTEGGARGAGTEAWAACDLNMDGLVDDVDFGIWYPYYDDYVGITPGVLSSRSTTAADNIDNRIGYAGYAWSASTATYNVRYRVYDPMMGTWLTRDPKIINDNLIALWANPFYDTEYLDGPNLYQYSRSEPLNRTDPTGLCTPCDFSDCFGNCMRDYALNDVGIALIGAVVTTCGAGFVPKAILPEILMPNPGLGNPSKFTGIPSIIERGIDEAIRRGYLPPGTGGGILRTTGRFLATRACPAAIAALAGYMAGVSASCAGLCLDDPCSF